MARYKIADNPFRDTLFENEECVEFETVGKIKVKTIVNKDVWYSYLKNHSWTAIKSGNRITVKTSIDKQSKAVWRVIVEHEYDELDYWGATIDHINNNPLDNRLSNLRVFSTAVLNSTNILSKYKASDMHYIYRQGSKDNPNGYKVHYGLARKIYYENFSVADYGSAEEALKAAKKYRDELVIKSREQVINEMVRKTRNIEFERGLRDKIQAGELDEVYLILRKYGILE